MKPSTEAQRRFGTLPVKRKPKQKLTREELDSGMPLDELRSQQARLKAEFLVRQAQRAA